MKKQKFLSLTLVFINILFVFIFSGCPITGEPVIPIINDFLTIDDFNQKIKKNEKISLKVNYFIVTETYNIKRAYSYIGFRNLPNNIEILNGKKIEELSNNDFCLIKTEEEENNNIVQIEFYYDEPGTYKFSINAYSIPNVENITEISDYEVSNENYYTYTINVSD